MAGVSNRSKISKQFSYDIVFDGALLSNTRASLVVELIKYILYERQQIPMPLDILKSQVKERDQQGIRNTHAWSAQASAQEQVKKVQSSTWGVNNRKAKCLISDLTKMFDNIQKAFESCPEIEQVAVILGGTVVSPKESYIIKFPRPCPDADYLPLVSCKRTLFRQVISEDILGSLKCDISPTNMMLLISAPRSCPLRDFVPKQFLCSPKTGSVISFNFHCTYFVPICHDLTFVEGECELSGIEPLHCHNCTNDGNVLLDITNDITEEPTNKCCLCEKRLVRRDSLSESEFFIYSRLSRNRTRRRSLSGKEEKPSCSGNFQISHVNNNSSHCKNLQVDNSLNTDAHVHKAEKDSNQYEKDEHLIPSNDPLADHGKIINLLHASPAPVDHDLLSGVEKLNLNHDEETIVDTDCIWYQSPLVIKGYKCQDNAHSNFRH